MTGSALALKLVISHEQDKLQNMEHGPILDSRKVWFIGLSLTLGGCDLLPIPDFRIYWFIDPTLTLGGCDLLTGSWL